MLVAPTTEARRHPAWRARAQLFERRASGVEVLLAAAELPLDELLALAAAAGLGLGPEPEPGTAAVATAAGASSEPGRDSVGAEPGSAAAAASESAAAYAETGTAAAADPDSVLAAPEPGPDAASAGAAPGAPPEPAKLANWQAQREQPGPAGPRSAPAAELGPAEHGPAAPAEAGRPAGAQPEPGPEGLAAAPERAGGPGRGGQPGASAQPPPDPRGESSPGGPPGAGAGPPPDGACTAALAAALPDGGAAAAAPGKCGATGSSAAPAPAPATARRTLLLPLAHAGAGGGGALWRNARLRVCVEYSAVALGAGADGARAAALAADDRGAQEVSGDGSVWQQSDGSGSDGASLGDTDGGRPAQPGACACTAAALVCRRAVIRERQGGQDAGVGLSAVCSHVDYSPAARSVPECDAS